jgi:hypothetical protein
MTKAPPQTQIFLPSCCFNRSMSTIGLSLTNIMSPVDSIFVGKNVAIFALINPVIGRKLGNDLMIRIVTKNYGVHRFNKFIVTAWIILIAAVAGKLGNRTAFIYNKTIQAHCNIQNYLSHQDPPVVCNSISFVIRFFILPTEYLTYRLPFNSKIKCGISIP